MKKKLKPLVGLAISAVFLYFAVSELEWNSFVEQLKNFRFEFFGLAVVLASIHGVVMAIKWKVVLNALASRVGFWESFWSLRISYFFNAVFPARLGEPIRLWFIQRKHPQLKFSSLVGATAGDRLVDLVALIAFVGLALMVTGAKAQWLNSQSLVITLLAFGCAIGGVALTAQLLKNSSSKIAFILKAFQQGLSFFKSKQRFLGVLSLAVTSWLFHIAMLLMLSWGTKSELSVAYAVFAMAAVSLAVSIPSTPSHIGTFEFAIIFVLHKTLGMNANDVAAIAVLYHLAQIIPTVLIGAIGLAKYYDQVLPRLKKQACENAQVA